MSTRQNEQSVSMSASDKLDTAPTRLRQIAFVARDIDQARQLLVRTCLLFNISATDYSFQTHVLGTEVIYEDPSVGQWGLKNFLSMVLYLRQLALADIARSPAWR